MILIKENDFLIRENDLKMRYNASPNFETYAIDSLFYTRQTQNNSHSCKQNTTFITLNKPQLYDKKNLGYSANHLLLF
jgi:hypothetical protein